jgi:SH3 domain protein
MSRRLAALVCGAVLLGLAGDAAAERAWVKDEVRLNLRVGPDTRYKIIGGLKTGDSVEILSRGDGWTQVRFGDREGWIPEGFLMSEAPAAIRLERQVAESSELRERFGTLSKEVEELRAENEQLTSRQASQTDEVERLSHENVALRAGARWPHWIAGASIFLVGSLVGIIVHWSTSRRNVRRIRL